MDDLKLAVSQAPILIVDDNPVNVALLEDVLDEGGYENLYSTTDPTKAVTLARAHCVDLILLDIRMPVMDGFQVMQALTDELKHGLPVLVLTAQNDRETRLRALTGGARDFVTKPFDTEEVLQRVRNLLELRLMLRERENQAEILEQKVHERTLEVREAQYEVIRHLARAGEYRDSDTGRHVERMSLFCQRLASAAGLPPHSCEHILYASQMHDLGKIGIPDSILHKPGKLDAAERRIINQHSAIGAHILRGNSPNPVIRMAHVIARTHHEKWDGSGYPDGLTGPDIPIEGRITAICDVFDALTMQRPYKPAWSIEDACDLLRKEAGKHFDPHLVELFLEILPDILAIKADMDLGAD
ncbi:MAG: HD domain-containing phosphohydrolase [Magnetospirillum sp.]